VTSSRNVIGWEGRLLPSFRVDFFFLNVIVYGNTLMYMYSRMHKGCTRDEIVVPQMAKFSSVFHGEASRFL
jgi:hypothetical protein